MMYRDMVLLRAVLYLRSLHRFLEPSLFFSHFISLVLGSPLHSDFHVFLYPQRVLV